ncbi:MAG: 2-isopropylmalate synthase [Clostridiales bacterium]|jgi:2-isopropylmalate synthase|nr:2-isopropylmalate synthase [Clostridiales bacterium]
MNHHKYRPFPAFEMQTRQWPNSKLLGAPVWCSVDLRDGNQALEAPMNLNQKLEFFNLLVKTGFKEIEIGFPAASDTEYNFARALIERGLIPDDVTIQVLTQSREHIIKRTFEAVTGARRAVIHLYNSTGALHRRVVFNKPKSEITKLAVDGAMLIDQLAREYGRERFVFEYSPEYFTGTEMDYAVEICESVLGVWKPTPSNKVILNLPSTVEMCTPNVYADQIEYFCNRIGNRNSVIISLHTHNDRGTAVAATELALMAGAERVEGTLFGNGERTGNADILNLALNLYSQGIDPQLDFSDIDKLVDLYERSTGLFVHPRHPYAGNLVFTAFSGSHQDAINKGLARLPELNGIWEVPYLPIDPRDVGRSYEPIIRINSQSGKGGVAFILQQNFGVRMPKLMQADFGRKVWTHSDNIGVELKADDIFALFKRHYIVDEPIGLMRYDESTDGQTSVNALITARGRERTITGVGEGIIDAFCKALQQSLGMQFDIRHYEEHSLEYSSRSRAITYMEISDANDNKFFGAGISGSVSKSSLRAVVSAVNNILIAGEQLA